MRYALYYTPEPGDPLLAVAEDWLGRSAFGRPVAQSDAAALEIVADARRYGFHATLKAPFELAEGRSEADLTTALAAWAAERSPVEAVRLTLGQPSGFFALLTDGPHAGVDALAADLVRAFEPFRAPLSPEDHARRKPPLLPERQRVYLERWGYPYVFEEFAFHMTLSGRLDGEAASQTRQALETRFAPLLAAPRRIGAVALFREPVRGADFEVAGLYPLAGTNPSGAA